MLNKVILIGRLTRDPELRHTQTGTAVATFSLAVERDFSAKEEKATDFIDIVAWRSTAEFVSKWFAKGMQVAVCGRLQIRDWTDKEGNKRRSAEVVADNVYFADSKRSGGESSANYQGGGKAPDGFNAADTGSDFSELSDNDGELPF